MSQQPGARYTNEERVIVDMSYPSRSKTTSRRPQRVEAHDHLLTRRFVQEELRRNTK